MPVVAMLPAIIGAGATLGGAALASHGATSAAKTQAGAAEKALGLTKEMYDTTRSDLAPYRALGGGAASSLGYLLGIGPPHADQAPATINQAQQTAQAMHTAGPGQPAMDVPAPSGGFHRPSAMGQAPPTVMMKAPNGQVGPVPTDRVQEALAKGGQVVNN